MNKSKVALVRCDTYAEEAVYHGVKRGIDLLGGIGNFVSPGEKIVLKPNVLVGSAPDKGVCTHPAVFKAVGRLLKEAGVIVSYGDSSALGPSEFNLKRAKLKRVGDEMGFILADFDHGKEITHKAALLNKKFIIANGVLEADGLISISKLKTHGFTRITGAVKNQFGCVPGLNKREFHFKMPDPYDFSTMLVDINTFIRPRLYIMDSVIAMEGNGPYGGKPRKLSLLLFSTDPIAMDSIACKLIGLNPEFVPTSKPGDKAGLGTYHYENIDLIGDNLDSFIVKDFIVVRKPPVHATGRWLNRFIRNQLTPRPVINAEKCTGCGTCIDVCPLGSTALSLAKDKAGWLPKHNYSQCIRCYCCQETCPEGAITIVTPFLGKLVFVK
jgi:uncharacterized protein (DUF362 family)/Pyruvate/2-oxoacid:ferredoxin oxidoreductase delta subunit